MDENIIYKQREDGLISAVTPEKVEIIPEKIIPEQRLVTAETEAVIDLQELKNNIALAKEERQKLVEIKDAEIARLQDLLDRIIKQVPEIQ